MKKDTIIINPETGNALASSPLFRNQKGTEYKTGILTVTDGVSKMIFAFHAPYSFEEESYKLITNYLDGWDSCYEAMVSKFMQCFDLATQEEVNDCFVYIHYNVNKDRVHCVENDMKGEPTNEYVGNRHEVIQQLADKTLSYFSRFIMEAIKENRLNKSYDNIQDGIRALNKLEPFTRY